MQPVGFNLARHFSYCRARGPTRQGQMQQLAGKCRACIWRGVGGRMSIGNLPICIMNNSVTQELDIPILQWKLDQKKVLSWIQTKLAVSTDSSFPCVVHQGPLSSQAQHLSWKSGGSRGRFYEWHSPPHMICGRDCRSKLSQGVPQGYTAQTQVAWEEPTRGHTPVSRSELSHLLWGCLNCWGFDLALAASAPPRQQPTRNFPSELKGQST
ncbi:UNVERIFIED_CONTAM: hypothetical protein K2H54_041725 [Gekko kuhli]